VTSSIHTLTSSSNRFTSTLTVDFACTLTHDFVSRMVLPLAPIIAHFGIGLKRSPVDLSPFTSLDHLTLTFQNLYAVQKTLRTILSTSRISTLTLRFSEGIANSEWQTRRSERGWSTDPETKEEDEHDSFLYLPPTIPISVRHWRLPYRIESKQKKCFLKAFEQRGPILAPSLKAVTIYTRRSSDKVRREAQGNSEDDEERRRKKRWEYRVEQVLGERGIAFIGCQRGRISI